MTLTKVLSGIFVSVLSLTAAGNASAYIVPGGPAPAPYDPIRPGYPPAPQYPPAPEYPNHPGYPDRPQQPGYGYSDERSVYLNRYVTNEVLQLRQLLGLDRQYEGFRVESVTVNVSRANYNSRMEFIIDGNVQNRIIGAQGAIQFFPTSEGILGQDIRIMRLRVTGEMYIDSIVVRLTDSGAGRPGRPGRPDQSREVVIPVNVFQNLGPQGRVDVSSYFDMYRYRGMRIVAIEVEANSRFNSALLDLYINGFNQGLTVNLTPWEQTFTFYPRDAVIGRNADNIMLQAQGEQSIHRVRVRLARY